ncbi:MAG: 1,4-alpha-glucan branching protein GlgB [Sedimentisphaerales bacterium]|nr:1,4-alpha-glucan branching protein GlgB [Sedimentisphaerales bacterium]
MKTEKSDVLAYGRMTEHDIYLFKQGNHFRLYDKLGAHPDQVEGRPGVGFGVWAPNAAAVSVIGDFNRWDPEAHRLVCRPDASGIWEGFIPHVEPAARYKYHIVSQHDQYVVDKGDPFGRYWELPPNTASVVWRDNYAWNDADWQGRRREREELNRPVSIYEVHLGSWKRSGKGPQAFLSYRDAAEELAEYVREMGFTHVELLPIMEHPFYGSWGYQTLGYFAPTSRYGTPADFKYLVDVLHQRGIGVILDWVPSHFPSNEYGLVYFDGTHLYEHADPRLGYHPDWKSYIFNYGRHEVRSFLISSALFWLDEFHADGLRVDAVASMLYLDYSRPAGEWIPNEKGGRENLEAIHFLRRLNEAVYESYPHTHTIAEESTAWAMVSRPTYMGGLGFGMKWNMGWMHDTLDYLGRNPIHRSYHHNQLTFSIWYSFSENFVLALSHDEVVHGKGSLLGRMPGDDWQRFANLRLLLGYQFTHPGKKLLFMGGEFGQWREWNHDDSLDWHLLLYSRHEGVRRWVRDLNRLYRQWAALHERDFDKEGFEWVDCNDWQGSVISYLRRGINPDELVLVVANFTPTARHGYRTGVPRPGVWRELLNSDARTYGGSGQGNLGAVRAEAVSYQGRYDQSVSLTLGPLGLVVLAWDGTQDESAGESAKRV